jgi:DnaK suppressor protein
MNKPPNQAREELVRQRDQLAERLEQIRRDETRRAAPLSYDSADRAQEQENDEVLAGLEETTGDLLLQYQHALERIDAGRYGVCEMCGFDIRPERLAAVPQATRCSACAEQAGLKAA